MIRKTRCLLGCLVALISVAGCGDEEDGLESTIERLNPSARVCVTSDTCVFGHCSTEDGECNLAPGCTIGSCPPGCFGLCVPGPSPEP